MLTTFPTLGHQLRAVMRAGDRPIDQADPRLRPLAASGLQTSVDSEGGYLIEPTFAQRLWERTTTTGEILRRVDQIPAQTGTVLFPQISETSRADGSRHGGLRAYRQAEAASLTASTPKFGGAERKLEKLSVLVYLTNELLSDADPVALQELIERTVPGELAYKLEGEIIAGDGVGQCTGLTVARCKIAVTKMTNQTAATVWGQNVVDMLARLWGPSQRTAVWLYHTDMLDSLSSLAVLGSYGSSSTVAFSPDLWNWDGTPTSGGWPTLAGRPAIPCEHCSAVGTEGDLILADLSQYTLGAMAQSMVPSAHVQFLYDEAILKFTWRASGMPAWASAVTPKNGSTTQSPIITLETRA